MGSSTLILLIAGVFILWLVFRFIRFLFRLVFLAFILIVALWLYEPSRNWLKQRMGINSQASP
jgi:hypothetical protein